MKRLTKRYAFTLAEAVITLSLLAVIAGILIPAATNITPSNVKTPFRNAYNLTATTIDNLINNENLYPSNVQSTQTEGSGESAVTYQVPMGFLYTSTGTKHGRKSDGTFADPTTNDDGTVTDSYSDTDALAWEYEALTRNCKCTTGSKLVRSFCCSLNATNATCNDSQCSFTTKNGMTWIAEQNSSCSISNRRTVPIMTVIVDINGNAKPNLNTGDRPDMYKFDVYANGKVELNSEYGSYQKAVEFLEAPTSNKKKS